MRTFGKLLVFGAAAAGAAAAITGSWSSAGASETVTYRYDARGRLIRVETTSAANTVTTNYAYDNADNRTGRTTTGAPK